MKKAVMYGAGNIGRGFIGQLFGDSGFTTAFVDIKKDVWSEISRCGKYTVYVTDGDDYRPEPVLNATGVDGYDKAAVAEVIAEADVMATAVGAAELINIAPFIAEGLLLRLARHGERPLNCIVCENLIHGDRVLRGYILDAVSAEDRPKLDRILGTVQASVGRMVPAPPAALLARDSLAICVDPYRKLQIDLDAIVGEMPEISGVSAYSGFQLYIERKLLMSNMAHAVLAYLGKLDGYTTIWECIGDAKLHALAAEAMNNSALALAGRHNSDPAPLLEYGVETLARFENKLLGDTVDRVGRDPARKLAANDRLIGTAICCEEQGINNDVVCKAAAAAMLFCAEGDTASQTVSAEAAKNGPEKTIQRLSGLSPDTAISKKICACYEALKAEK